MTCAKRRVTCVIYAPGGLMVAGDNWCANPQPVCPREPGEGYDKCKSICQQLGHAEETALMAAEELGIDVRGGEALITGHERVCDTCSKLLSDAGIKRVQVAP
jgi:deoxycytidylate deaminase